MADTTVTPEKRKGWLSKSLESAEAERDEYKARAEKAEGMCNDLAVQLANGANDCPYLTFWGDDPEAAVADWCKKYCSNSEEYGHECNYSNPEDCWLEWAAAQAAKE